MCTHAHMSHTCTPSLLFLPSIWPHFQCLYRTGTCIGQYCVGSVAVIFAVQNKTTWGPRGSPSSHLWLLLPIPPGLWHCGKKSYRNSTILTQFALLAHPKVLHSVLLWMLLWSLWRLSHLYSSSFHHLQFPWNGECITLVLALEPALRRYQASLSPLRPLHPDKLPKQPLPPPMSLF